MGKLPGADLGGPIGNRCPNRTQHHFHEKEPNSFIPDIALSFSLETRMDLLTMGNRYFERTG